jgi:hypothetical protein
MLYEPKKYKIMKYTAFCGTKNGDCAACFKNSVSILVAYMYKLSFWGGEVVPVVHPSRMWDTRLAKVKAVIGYCIVSAHSLTSIDNTTVDRTV